jgi:YfiH family protein
MKGVFCTRTVTEGIAPKPDPVASMLGRMFPDKHIHVLNQMHSDNVVNAEDLHDSEIPDADGIVSRDPSRILCLRTADCLPVLAWGSDKKVIGAFHAGWKGLVAGIIKNGLNAMRDLGADDIELWIGPAIGPCCFEVSHEVGMSIDPERIRQRNGAFYIDLWEAAFHQICSLGIPPHKIHVMRLCTSCYKEIFFSYRRDGESAGRNISLIGGGSWSLPGLQAV